MRSHLDPRLFSGSPSRRLRHGCSVMRTPYEKGTQRPSKECSKDMFRIPFAGLCHPEALARALADGNPELDMEVAGSGQRGIGPLIPERNALPMKGFVAGKTQGNAYRLVLCLAAFELRKPEPKT